MPSSQSRLLQSRVSLLQQTLRQLTKKILNIDHNITSFSNKQEYLQNCISKLSIRVDELVKNITTKRYGLSDITMMTGYGNFNSGNKTVNGIKESNSNQQIMQLLESLQAMMLTNLEQLENKLTISYNEIESKCGNMELKFMGIWKQAQTLMQSLSYQIQSCQHKIRSIEDKQAYQKEYIQSNIHDLQHHVNQVINRSNDKFIQQIQTLHQQVAGKIGLLEERIGGFVEGEEIHKIKLEINSSLEKVNKNIDEKLEKKVQDAKKDINTTTEDISKNLFSKLQQKLSNVEKQNNRIKQKLETIQTSLREAQKKYVNLTVSNELKQSNQIYAANQNSQGSYQRWSENSFQNLVAVKKPLPQQKKFQPQSSVQNKLLSQQSYSTNRIESRYQEQKKESWKNERYDEKNEEQEMPVRGIGGLKNLRKKEGEKKGSVSKGKRYEEAEMNEQRNPLVRGGGLRPISGIDSPSKGNKKPLPPLASQKAFTRPKHNPAPINKHCQQNSQQQQQSGEQSYFLDQQGYLIDIHGNRLINQDGQQIQLSPDDLVKLRQLNDNGY